MGEPATGLLFCRRLLVRVDSILLTETFLGGPGENSFSSALRSSGAVQSLLR